MTTAAIDVNTLNELFENQSKLDDIFDSFFDDDSLLSSSVTKNGHASAGAFGNDQDLDFNDDLLFFPDDNLDQQQRSMFGIAAPIVIEIVALYFTISYFI